MHSRPDPDFPAASASKARGMGKPQLLRPACDEVSRGDEPCAGPIDCSVPEGLQRGNRPWKSLRGAHARGRPAVSILISGAEDELAANRGQEYWHPGDESNVRPAP